MAVKNFKKKVTAKRYASRNRKRGLKSTVYKKANGYAVSSTRGK